MKFQRLDETLIFSKFYRNFEIPSKFLQNSEKYIKTLIKLCRFWPNDGSLPKTVNGSWFNKKTKDWTSKCSSSLRSDSAFHHIVALNLWWEIDFSFFFRAWFAGVALAYAFFTDKLYMCDFDVGINACLLWFRVFCLFPLFSLYMSDSDLKTKNVLLPCDFRVWEWLECFWEFRFYFAFPISISESDLSVSECCVSISLFTFHFGEWRVQSDLSLLCFYLVFVKTAALTWSLGAVTSAAVYWFKYKAFLRKTPQVRDPKTFAT